MTDRRKCGTMAVHMALLESAPEFRTHQRELEASTRQMMTARQARRDWEVRRIPVVVHVVYEQASDDIPDSQIHSQIAVLNADFRARNADRANVPAAWAGLVADSFVEFALATRDPQGNATSGITRTRTHVPSFGGDEVKFSASGGADAWPADRYLNIWVCRLGGGILGYAQFPGGPAETDGVVITSTAFGTSGTAQAPFDRGRTATHEVGHWLNLRHIWGDTEDCSGTDFVDDTPNAAGPNYGTPTFPSVSCSNGPNGDMFVNYMDYVDDVSMFMFTSQQVTRMRTTLERARRTIGTHRELLDERQPVSP